MKVTELPRVHTGFTPTPLHKLENLSQLYGVNIFIKRDDMTGLGLGGNKLRKLDYFIADALQKNATTLLTFGGVQTNHGRLTAAAGAKFGLKCALVLTGPPPKHMSGNLTLDKMLGATLYFADTSSLTHLPPAEQKPKQAQLIEKATKQAIADCEMRGERVYTIAPGGSDLMGIAAYIMCAQELKEQCEGMDIHPQHLYCAYASGGTFAGLSLGAKYFGCPFSVHGVVTEKFDDGVNKTVAYINEACALYDMKLTFTKEELLVEQDYLAFGYPFPDPETRKFVYLLAQKEGILLDMCNTSKAFRGMIENIKKGKIKQGETVIFLHTGGLPDLFTGEHLMEMEKELWPRGFCEVSL